MCACDHLCGLECWCSCHRYVPHSHYAWSHTQSKPEAEPLLWEGDNA